MRSAAVPSRLGRTAYVQYRERQAMTFSCKNYDFNLDKCQKLNSECIPGRPGCVLEGRFKFGEEVEKRLAQLEQETAERRRRKQQGR